LSQIIDWHMLLHPKHATHATNALSLFTQIALGVVVYTFGNDDCVREKESG
jgi:hypothetical protein